MRIPFWPKRRPTKLVVSFTQEIDLHAVVSGAPGLGGTFKMVITCSCGGEMHCRAPWVMTRSNSVTQPYACEGCGDRVDMIYTYAVVQPDRHDLEKVTAGWPTLQRDRSEDDL